MDAEGEHKKFVKSISHAVQVWEKRRNSITDVLCGCLSWMCEASFLLSN